MRTAFVNIISTKLTRNIFPDNYSVKNIVENNELLNIIDYPRVMLKTTVDERQQNPYVKQRSQLTCN